MANVNLTGNFLATARCLIFADSATGVWSFNPNTNTLTITAAGGATSAANPTAKVGLVAVNGSALTWMRSDAAPPIDQGITPTWTGLQTFGAGLTVSAGSTTISGHVLTLSATASVGGTNTGDQTLPVGANPSATIGLSAVNGFAATFMTSDSAPALSQAIAPTWTGNHIFTPTSGVAIKVNGFAGSAAVTSHGDNTGLRVENTASTTVGVLSPVRFWNGAANTTDLALAAAGAFNLYVNGSGTAAVNVSTTNALTAAGAVGVNGNSPPAKVTGWGTPTNQAVVANYNASAATLLQTADAVAQIITDLKAFGLYGA